MNAISPSVSTHQVQRSSAFGNLVRKECLESREAAIAGLAIFWLVPAVLGLIEFALEGHHGVIPFAWLLVIGAGWLYAVIVGAHAVCRDWGKAEEHFLLAQPVSPRTVVCAKLITGAALVAGVLGIAVGWDMMLVHGTAFGTHDEFEWLLVIISAAAVMAAGFAVAFAVAVMTRQMLASTIVATLVLLVWAIAPLLSSHLAHFWVPVLLFGGHGPTSAVPFVLVSFAMLAVSAVAGLYYSTRERVYHLGNKQLAWTTGLVMLTLFGVAMSEVGNSLHVRDQVMLPESASSVFGIVQTIQRGDRFLVAYGDYRPQSHPEMARWFMKTFRVSGSGHIQDLRRTPIPGALPPIILDPQTPGRRWDLVTGFAFDKDEHVVVSGKRLRIVSATQGSELDTLWRTTLAWPDGGEPEVLSHIELALPPGQSFQTTEPWRQRRDHLPRFSYLVSVAGRTNEELYVFDWSDGPNPGPRYVVPLPQDSPSVSVGNGKVRVSRAHGRFAGQHVFVADFDADHPETLLDKQNWSFHEFRGTDENAWAQGFERFGGEYIQVDQHGDDAYLSDLLGLRVARQTRPGRWEIAGECRTSPLSMLFRLYPRPQALDDTLVIEWGWRGIIAYDVSDPSDPKRIGFLSTPDLSWLDTSIFATGRYLVLHEFDLISVLDRPITREP